MAVKREKVTRIIDGETFETSGRNKSIRLANVCAPETGTQSGVRAAKYLDGLIGGRMVEVDTLGRDGFGSAMARVRVNGESVNLTMNRKLWQLLRRG